MKSTMAWIYLTGGSTWPILVCCFRLTPPQFHGRVFFVRIFAGTGTGIFWATCVMNSCKFTKYHRENPWMFEISNINEFIRGDVFCIRVPIREIPSHGTFWFNWLLLLPLSVPSVGVVTSTVITVMLCLALACSTCQITCNMVRLLVTSL